MSDDEAQMAGEKNMRHSHATHDLYNHIGSGKTANWVRGFFAPTEFWASDCSSSN